MACRDDAGMLFVYQESGQRSMWMKNTYLSLDMVFIRDDGVVASITRDTEPLSLRTLNSREAVRYVLELPGGTTESLHIEAGDRLFWEPP